MNKIYSGQKNLKPANESLLQKAMYSITEEKKKSSSRN